MTKTQRLRNAAEGFMAGLVLAGFDEPFGWAHHQWEGAFYRAWGVWDPASDKSVMPDFALGGHGRQSQPRDMLWQLARTSPFHEYKSEPLNRMPMAMPADEYLDLWVEGATAEEWRELARAFLDHMGHLDD